MNAFGHMSIVKMDKWPLGLLINKAAPTALSINNPRANNPRRVITNSGSLRFDIYSGPFTKHGQLTAPSFTNAFVHILRSPRGLPP